MPDQQPLFIAGVGGYVTYRIPSLVVTPSGTVLAFCEGRTEWRDTCEIHLLLRRSFDGGRNWGDVQLVAKQKDTTCGNPCAVVERQSGAVLLAFCKNPLLEGSTDQVAEGKGERTVWLTRSDDDGATWSEPRELTSEVKKADWTWYATGPGHGIQLVEQPFVAQPPPAVSSGMHSRGRLCHKHFGRLVLPCNHQMRVNMRADDPAYSHVIVSDDGGASWRIGGQVGPGNDECTVVEPADGELYLNCRNVAEVGFRACARSTDGGLSFGPRRVERALIEPTLWNGCHASLVRCRRAGEDCVLFANPAWREEVRLNMTVRLSRDGCRTWSEGKVLHPGPSAYSDLAVTSEGTILCLYERGDEHPYQTLTLARLELGEVS